MYVSILLLGCETETPGMQGFAVEIFDALLAQRETAKLPAALKLYVWAPVSMAYFLAVFREDMLPLVEEMVARENVSVNDAAYTVSTRFLVAK